MFKDASSIFSSGFLVRLVYSRRLSVLTAGRIPPVHEVCARANFSQSWLLWLLLIAHVRLVCTLSPCRPLRQKDGSTFRHNAMKWRQTVAMAATEMFI